MTDVGRLPEFPHRCEGEDFFLARGIALEGFAGHFISNLAGGDGVEPDASSSPFDREGVDEPGESVFRGGIGRNRRDAEERGHRGNEKDASTAASCHPGSNGFAEGKGSRHVSLPNGVKFLISNFLRRFLEVDASVVHQNCRGHRNGDLVALTRLGHVQHAMAASFSEGGISFEQSVRSPTGQNDIRPGIEKGPGNSEADAGSAAGDQGAVSS